MPAVSFSPESEEMLISGLKTDNRQAFDVLYKDYAPVLLGFIVRIVGDKKSAEKVLQRAFLEIWNARMQFDPNCESLFTWLMMQVRKTAMQYLSLKQKKTNYKNPEDAFPVYIANGSDETEQGNFELVLSLLYYNNYSLKDAAEILKISEDKLKIILRKAIKHLKTLTHG